MNIIHDKRNHQFRVHGRFYYAVLLYAQKGKVLDFYHIYLPLPMRGSGLAGRMLVHAFDYAQEKGFKVIPSCSFISDEFLKLFSKSGPTPETLLKTPIPKLRAAGLSGQKVDYMRDAARKFLNGTINPRKFARMSSKEITDHLVQIKGVGVWTAHMLLIFTLLRSDILPTGDLGIRKGFQKVFRLRSMPDHKRMEKLAKEWRAHASVASWYLWRVVDNEQL